MTQVGGSGGSFDFVPTSSSIMHSTCSQWAALALGRPSVNRSRMNDPVLRYHASPSFGMCVGMNAGQLYLSDPSPCDRWTPLRMIGCCLTSSAVSPCSASPWMYSIKSLMFPSPR